MENSAKAKGEPLGRPKRHFLSSLLLGLSAVFNVAAAPPVSETPSYWKIPGYDATFEVVKCEKKGICATIHSLNAQDPKIKELFSDLMDKADPLPRRAPPRVINDEDIHSLCGYKPEITIEQKSAGNWHGTFLALVSGREYTLKLIELSEGGLHVKINVPYIFFLGKDAQAERVLNPPPACVATRSMKEVLKLKL